MERWRESGHREWVASGSPPANPDLYAQPPSPRVSLEGRRQVRALGGP